MTTPIKNIRAERIQGTLDGNGFNMTGSLIITGSITIITGSNIELQVLNTGVRLGNIFTDAHTVTGSFSVSGSSTFRGDVIATSSLSINGQVRINNQAGGTPTEQGISAGVVSNYWGTEDGKFLSTPNTWLAINLDGTTYFLPAYL